MSDDKGGDWRGWLSKVCVLLLVIGFAGHSLVEAVKPLASWVFSVVIGLVVAALVWRFLFRR